MEIEEREYYSLMNRENLKGGKKEPQKWKPVESPPSSPLLTSAGRRGGIPFLPPPPLFHQAQ